MRTGLSERPVLVVGAHTGAGLACARGLVQRGMPVVLGAPTLERAACTSARVAAHANGVFMAYAALSLHRQASIAAFVAPLRGPIGAVLLHHEVAVPEDAAGRTVEAQVGAAYVGRLALAARLRAAPVPPVRLVTATTLRAGPGCGRAARWAAYGLAWRASMLFHRELARRVAAGGPAIRAVGCPPQWVTADDDAAGRAARALVRALTDEGLRNGDLAGRAPWGRRMPGAAPARATWARTCPLIQGAGAAPYSSVGRANST